MSFELLTSLKGKFQSMQDGISASLKNFKIREERPHSSKSLTSWVNFNAGAEIKINNEKQFNEIHSMNESNIKEAELVDKKILDIHNKLNSHLRSLGEIYSFTSNINKFTKKIDSISTELESLQNIVNRANNSLLDFENAIEEEELRLKMKLADEELLKYIDKKNREYNEERDKLEADYIIKVMNKEKEIQSTLKEKRELFDMAFQQDMQLYKESGILPNMRGNDNSSVVSLDDVVIDDDMDALNELLES